MELRKSPVKTNWIGVESSAKTGCGGAEPCPFSPYSAMNLKTQSILEVLHSPFFEKVREISASE
ncbi:MAG: hypothetical protein LBL49_09235 [Clostridiales Family XIII bacterium]|jgi:hypothetical protein|nr:hypothetical protein [Clostridiales Family XIII bacterium]